MNAVTQPVEIPQHNPGTPAKEPPGVPAPNPAPDIPPVRENPAQPAQPVEFPQQSPPAEIPGR